MSNIYVLHLTFLLFAGVPVLISGLHQDENTTRVDFTPHPDMKYSWKFLIHTKDQLTGIELDVNKKSPYVKANTRTKIIIHGFFDTEDEIQQIVKEYLNVYEDINVITFSWDFIHNMTYLAAAKVASFIGEFVLGRNIAKLGCKNNLQPQQIHLVGYNLGAHLAGRAAELLGVKIGRITGLDPSRNCFEVPCNNEIFPGLSKKGADFIDILHTSSFIDGFESPIGTVDLYPNGGTFQPACDKSKSESCDSIMSLKYFAESIKYRNNFYALECSNCIKFLNLECREEKTIIWTGMDINVTEISPGTFFFATRAKSPYGMGVAGISLY